MYALHFRIPREPFALTLSAAAIPTETYEVDGRIAKEDATCAICLGEYESGEQLKRLPCQHHFHSKCIDDWLPLSKRCAWACACSGALHSPCAPRHQLPLVHAKGGPVYGRQRFQRGRVTAHARSRSTFIAPHFVSIRFLHPVSAFSFFLFFFLFYASSARCSSRATHRTANALPVRCHRVECVACGTGHSARRL